MRDSAQWFWCYNAELKQLAISTGDGEPLVLPYKPQQLVNIGFSQQGFDVEDANAYQQVLEFLQSYHQDALPVEPTKRHCVPWVFVVLAVHKCLTGTSKI